MNKSILKNKTVQSGLWFCVFLICWECASRFGLVNTYILPPFTEVASNLFHELFQGKLGIQVCNSLIVILRGFGLSFFLAIIITLLCVWIPPVESLLSMLCTVFNPLPSVAIMPLIIMWFGVNTTAMLVVIVHGVLWALVTNILNGFRSIPVLFKEWAKNIGLTPWQLFKDVLIYFVMPSLLAGVRIGWGRAWRALISAEMVFGMIGNLGGLGYYIYTNRAYANLTNVMSGVVVIIIIGILVESCLFSLIEKVTIRKWGMTSG